LTIVFILNINMPRHILDELRERLEDIENIWLFLLVLLLAIGVIAGGTLYGVYLYTRH
jgi:hypothetical protein